MEEGGGGGGSNGNGNGGGVGGLAQFDGQSWVEKEEGFGLGVDVGTGAGAVVGDREVEVWDFVWGNDGHVVSGGERKGSSGHGEKRDGRGRGGALLGVVGAERWVRERGGGERKGEWRGGMVVVRGMWNGVVGRRGGGVVILCEGMFGGKAVWGCGCCWAGVCVAAAR